MESCPFFNLKIFSRFIYALLDAEQQTVAFHFLNIIFADFFTPNTRPNFLLSVAPSWQTRGGLLSKWFNRTT